ncbi:MAG TPA: hypothetical protein VIC85_18650 [Ktedonobacterales bacterium]|jgi:hypothetical protein
MTVNETERDTARGARAKGMDLRGFGALLREYRESYGERILQRDRRPGRPRVRLTAQALIACMEETGYSISSGSYSEIEAGNTLPRDARSFVRSVSVCLELDDAQSARLTEQLAYDIVRSKLGDLADQVFHR